MASIAAKVGIRTVSPAARQLVLAWVIGSVTMGTVAALFLSFPPLAQPLTSLVSPGTSQIEPLAALPLPARVAVLALVVVLFAALAALAWRTPGASLLPASVRGRVWWTLLVGLLGLAAWFFAATVTFGANFSPALQLALGYGGGGLPFALMAALLQRSWRVNLGAVVISVMLLVAGFLLVASRSPGTNALSLYFRYIDYLFSSNPGLPVGPIHGPRSPFGPIVGPGNPSGL
jgi:hypothetical protein